MEMQFIHIYIYIYKSERKNITVLRKSFTSILLNWVGKIDGIIVNSASSTKNMQLYNIVRTYMANKRWNQQIFHDGILWKKAQAYKRSNNGCRLCKEEKLCILEHAE